MSEPTGAPTPAVMPEFSDAAGLDKLLAAGGRSVGATPSHGAAKPSAPPPAVSNWPPPKTAEPFKVFVRQLDQVGSTVATLASGVTVEQEPPEFMDNVADGLWPLAYYYGAGSEKPSVGMLWAYAAISVLGLVAVKLARVKTQALAAPKEPTEPAA